MRTTERFFALASTADEPAVFGAMTIEPAEEFVRLRTSEDPHDYPRAATEDAAESVWRAVVARSAEMRLWVAQSKSVPLSILRLLAVDDDPRVRSMVAAKRKLDDALCCPRPGPQTRCIRAHHPRGNDAGALGRHRGPGPLPATPSLRPTGACAERRGRKVAWFR